MKFTKPGIYFNMDNDTYHADPSISNSGMGQLLKSPLHYWHASPFNPERVSLDSLALRQGRVMHTLLLEPEKFNEEWEIKEGVNSTKKVGMIGEGDFKKLEKSVNAVRETELLSQLFKNGYPEVSIFWTDEETDVPCRIRADYLTANFVSDLKSTADISNYKIGYAVCDYGYDRQAAFYMEGIRQIKRLLQNGVAVIEGKVDDAWLDRLIASENNMFIYVFQEKSPPFVTRAMQVADDVIDHGALKFREALKLYKDNLSTHGTNKWPSPYKSVELMQLDDLPQKIFY